MRIFTFLFLFTFLLAKPVSIKDAFHYQFTSQNNKIEFNLKIANGVHIYRSSLKIFVNNKLITPIFPVSKKDYLGDDIYENNFKILIPKGNIKVIFQGCSDTACYAPQTAIFNLKSISKKPSSNEDKIVRLFNKSIWVVLGSFFVFGLLLSLTPCIFPMIPILSGLIVKSGSKGKITPLRGLFISVIYVLSMSVAYTIAGVLAGLFGGNIQVLFQNPYILGSFSLIFVILAFSMFGFFEIGLPASLQTKLTLKSDKAGQNGGLIGVAIMGFISALIVGPCVAPPLAGALMYIGQTGNAILGGSALFVMSIGMGVPLFIVGLGAGKFMPRAGGWMMNVNKVFGVIMLGVAIYMASRILPNSITTILWAILAIGSGLYLNPFSKMEDYKQVIFKTIGFILIIVGSISIYKVMNPIQNTTTIQSKNIWQDTKNLDNLSGDVIVDFTAKWCIACKEYEESTFKNPQVLDELKKYKLLRIDVTNNTKQDKLLMKKFGLVGPPAILVFHNAKLRKKIIGYKKAEEFLKEVKKKQ